MRKMRGTVGAFVLTGVLIACVAGMAGAEKRFVYHPQSGDYVVPRVEIIAFDQTVALFDTTTGAIHKFRGDLNNPSVRCTWELRVPPIDGPTSGVLEIQKAKGVNGHADATFLVDSFNGDTWILRQRSNSNRSWDPVKIFN